MAIIDKIKEAYGSVGALAALINGNAKELFDYFNATHGYLKDDKAIWNELVLRNKQVLRNLDYSDPYVRAFLVCLLEYAMRFGQRAVVVSLMPVIRKHDIVIGKRLEAISNIFYPKISHSEDLLNRFEPICSLLYEAWLDGDVDNRGVEVAILRYYAYVVENTQPQHVSRFIDAMDAKAAEWPVLSQIKDVISGCGGEIRAIYQFIDNSLERNDAPIVAYEHGPGLIETDTNYAGELGLNGVNADFRSIRELAKGYASGKQLRQRGTEIIDNHEDLAEYMKRYGNMHFAKICSAFESPFPVIGEKTDIIDWGCGQSISTMAAIEKIGAGNVNMIVLIEPSQIALKRAAAHCRKLVPTANIITICSDFDSLNPADLPKPTSNVAVNVLSNVLDMDCFSQQHLIELAESMFRDKNYFVCASPFTNEAATARLETFRYHFQTNYPTFCLYHDEVNSAIGEYWMCNNRYYYGINRHGGSPYCGDYYGDNGCYRRWTRVLKVFSV
ncbi:hypothetical protein [uncultured Muribaculum sp.]|uniref:hypothetical protein n=2 Tax=uncultured Muribaculum sp. TaxID=1918613 RepID=UPI002676C3C7|nr:hypothetical protein [uncultured Muribaculum sp.]